MSKPIIGITSFALDLPCSRSAVNQAYIDSVVAAGGSPIVLPLKLNDDNIDDVYALIDGLLLPGGDDVDPRHYGEHPHPGLGQIDGARDVVELAVAQRALRDDIPVLGICRGVQLLAVAAGGSLYQDIPTEVTSAMRHEVREYGRNHLAHSIRVHAGSRLAEAVGTSDLDVNSFHHQAVRDLPEGFVISAEAPDGIIEAIEDPSARFTVGVQCHPEEMWDTTVPDFLNLFRSFVRAAGQRCVTSPRLVV